MSQRTRGGVASSAGTGGRWSGRAPAEPAPTPAAAAPAGLGPVPPPRGSGRSRTAALSVLTRTQADLTHAPLSTGVSVELGSGHPLLESPSPRPIVQRTRSRGGTASLGGPSQASVCDAACGAPRRHRTSHNSRTTPRSTKNDCLYFSPTSTGLGPHCARRHSSKSTPLSETAASHLPKLLAARMSDPGAPIPARSSDRPGHECAAAQAQ